MSRIMQRMWTFLGFEEDERGAPARDPGGGKAPVFSLHTQRTMEIVVLQPGAYEEAQTAADYLKTNRPLVVNLRAAQKELGQRVVDFLSGVTYALDGHMQRVGRRSSYSRRARSSLPLSRRTRKLPRARCFRSSDARPAAPAPPPGPGRMEGP